MCGSKTKKGKACDKVFSDFYIVEIEKCKAKKKDVLCVGRQTFLAVGKRCALPVLPCNKKRTERIVKTTLSLASEVPQVFSEYVSTVFPVFVFRKRATFAKKLILKAVKELSKHGEIYPYVAPTVESIAHYTRRSFMKHPEAVAFLDNMAKILIIKSTEMKEFRPLALLAVLAEAGIALGFNFLDFEKFAEHIKKGEYGVALQIAHEGVLTAVSLKSFSINDADSLSKLIEDADNIMSRKLEIISKFLKSARENMCMAVPEDRESVSATVLPDGTVGIRFGAHIGYVDLLNDGRVKITYIDHNLIRLRGVANYLKNVGYKVNLNEHDAKIEIIVDKEKLDDLFKDLTLTMSVDILGCYSMFEAKNREELIKKKKECIKNALGVESLC